MTKSRIAEVLYDSETMLRLVDSELDELRDDGREAGFRGNNVGVLLAVMQRATTDIAQVLCTLHTSREALQGATLQEIHDSATKLGEVCSATEIAATHMMDSLERAVTLVDRLDDLDPAPVADTTSEAGNVRVAIREELFAVMGSLQFQDITAQQLGHVSQMLRDIERRLHATSALLSGGCDEAESLSSEPMPTFSESASTQNSFERQATADALFWGEHSSMVTH
jgi:chemotaxis regulatin CheY-phosphate phosphatase CheZ